MSNYEKTIKALNYIKQLDTINYEQLVGDLKFVQDPNNEYWNTEPSVFLLDELIDFIVDIISEYDHCNNWQSILIKDNNSLLFTYSEAALLKKDDDELNNILIKIINDIQK
jgi:hypothetical protein